MSIAPSCLTIHGATVWSSSPLPSHPGTNSTASLTPNSSSSPTQMPRPLSERVAPRWVRSEPFLCPRSTYSLCSGHRGGHGGSQSSRLHPPCLPGSQHWEWCDSQIRLVFQVFNGYFVHYFAPDNMDPIPKNILFVIDVSGSMWGIKMKQVSTP